MPEAPSDRANRLLAAFDAEHGRLGSFGRVVEQLVQTIVEQEGLRVHSVTHRIKHRDSLGSKIARIELVDGALSEVPDVVGLRVITYFSDDVDTIARLIEREFTIDPKRSSDRRSLLEADRFGYISLHYVATLSNERVSLPEYRSYRNMCLELQVRSILQHSWAEIEHDLGYKSVGAIPRQIRRRFSRLAGLLEIADDEFVALRDELGRHRDQVTESIERGETDIALDLDSLTAFITANPLVRELDQRVAAQIDSFVNDKQAPSADIDRLHYVGISTVDEVLKLLTAKSGELVQFARLWLRFPPSERAIAEYEEYFADTADASEEHSDSGFSPGISLFYLVYLLVAERNNRSFAIDYFLETGIGGEDHEVSNADQLVTAYRWLQSGLQDPPEDYEPDS